MPVMKKTALFNGGKLMLSANSRVDLHLHSTASDGVRTPQEIIQDALGQGVELIALTDHDTMRNTQEFNDLVKQAGLLTIKGMEVSALIQDQVVHILGYGLDPNSSAVQQYTEYYQQSEKRSDLRTIARLRLHGYQVSEEDYTCYVYNQRRGCWKLCAYLLDKGVVKNFAEYCAFQTQGLIENPQYWSAGEVISMIHQAQGKAIIAHAFDYQKDDPRALLDQLRYLGLDGIECFHSHHNKDQAQALCEYAQNYHLLITGGSDDHGHLPDRKMGSPAILYGQLKLGSLIDKID